jgi:hypothetical protein
MGLTPHEYYCMSPLEFYYASRGHLNKYYKELEQTRIISYTVASTVPSKTKLPNMQKWMPLPNDIDTGITNNRALEIFKIIKDSHANKRIKS